jgi:hypothetical protein
MPQLDFDGANSKISADKIQGQSGTTVTIPAGHNLVGDGSGLTNLPAHTGNVAFPATQVASADANTLDDYEEGTWTPTIIATTNDHTYTLAAGQYIKIGKAVFLTGRISINSAGTTSGSCKVGALPFTALDDLGYGGTIHFGQAASMNMGTAGYHISATLNGNDVTASMRLWDAAAGVTSLQFSEISAGASMQFSGLYFANA